MPTPLTEHIADWRAADVSVDAEQRLVQNVALTGAQSRNGYHYAEPALRDAVSLYENRPVFLDHPRAPGRPLDRSARDLIGSIVRARYEDGRIRGDIQTLDTDAGRTFLALARAEQPAVGMSHVVLADRTENTIDRIHEVISVDAVVFPATTTSLSEQSASPPASTTAPPASPPAPPGGIFPPAQPDPTHSAWPNPVEPSSLDQGHAPRLAHVPPSRVPRAGAFPTPIAEILARLPPAAHTPHFLQQLEQAADEPTREALLNDRLLLLERLTPRTTSPPRLQTPTTLTDQTIIETLRRNR